MSFLIDNPFKNGRVYIATLERGFVWVATIERRIVELAVNKFCAKKQTVFKFYVSEHNPFEPRIGKCHIRKCESV